MNRMDKETDPQLLATMNKQLQESQDLSSSYVIGGVPGETQSEIVTRI